MKISELLDELNETMAGLGDIEVKAECGGAAYSLDRVVIGETLKVVYLVGE